MKIIRKKHVYEEYNGKTVKTTGHKYLKTFWLVCEEEGFEEKYHMDNAPKWVLKHLKDLGASKED